MRRMLLGSMLVLAPATVGFAQNTVRMEQLVQSYVSSAGFSGTVLVARGDSVVFRNGYGVSPDAASPVASITKQFTAAAILLLEEQGRLRIDDLVSRHLPEAPAAWKTMTIFHLLTHTAGFQGLATPPAARRGLKSADGTVAGFVKAAMEGSLDAQPGETFNYTNSGYFILGHVIQQISGQSYERFIQDNIFTPLQMKETTLEKGAENPNTAAGFHSTTADLLKWQLALYGGKVLSAASLKKMTASFKGDYGLGIYIRTIDGRKVMTHGGGVPTFANLTYFPETRTSVVVLGNPNPKAAPASEIAAYLGTLAHGGTVTLASERKAITLAADVMQRYAGQYAMGGTSVMVVVNSAQLALQPPDGRTIPLLAESETSFFIEKTNVRVEFVRDAGGVVTGLVVHQGTHQERATRLR
jgi:CubicO group peptidase (beta-lactamase class C family)